EPPRARRGTPNAFPACVNFAAVSAPSVNNGPVTAFFGTRQGSASLSLLPTAAFFLSVLGAALETIPAKQDCSAQVPMEPQPGSKSEVPSPFMFAHNSESGSLSAKPAESYVVTKESTRKEGKDAKTPAQLSSPLDSITYLQVV